MRILHVISSIHPSHGGVSEGVRQLSEVLMTLGCRVAVATLDAPDQPFLNQFPFPVYALGPGVTHFQYGPRLAKWLDANIQSYDIVVAHALWQYHTVAVRRAALKFRVPYVVYTHGMLDPYFKRASPLKHAKKWLFWPWADYRVLRDANAVLFTTEEERRLAAQSFWLYSARERVVNLGTSRPSGQADSQRAAFYSSYPQLRAKKLAVFLGRIHPKKGCDLAIRAFAQVFSSNPDWCLVMAGPDQVGWRSELERLTATFGLAERVVWTGMLSGDEKWGALRSAQFFFLPSHQENFGVVVAEALACAVPTLISNKVNIWREIEDAGCGLVAEDTLAGSVDLLTRWLTLGNAGQARMRAATVACFEEKFEIKKATANLLSTLQEFVPTTTAKAQYVNV